MRTYLLDHPRPLFQRSPLDLLPESLPLSWRRFLHTLRGKSPSSDIPLVGLLKSRLLFPLLRSTILIIPLSKLEGAAIALLDAVYLPLHLPSNVTVRYVGYASPRVSNSASVYALRTRTQVDSFCRSATRRSQTTSTRSPCLSRASTTSTTPSQSYPPSTSSATTTPAARSTSVTTTCGSRVPVGSQSLGLSTLRLAGLSCAVFGIRRP